MNRIHRIGDRELGIAGFEVITLDNSEILSKNPISIHCKDFCAFEVEAEAHFL